MYIYIYIYTTPTCHGNTVNVFALWNNIPQYTTMTAIPIADSHPSNNAIFPNGISCFDNHCCLRIVLVSAVKKGKCLPQCKVLRKDFCTVQSWDIWSHFLLCELMLLVQANIETGRKGIVLFLL